MKYVLIIIMGYNVGGVGIHEFNTKEDCNSAALKTVQEAETMGVKARAFCVHDSLDKEQTNDQ